MGGLYAEFVEYRGAEAGQRPHSQREGRHLRSADARRVEGDSAEPPQMGKQLFPQAHLAPDAGEEQQRLAFSADLSMDPQPSDAQLLVPDRRDRRGCCHQSLSGRLDAGAEPGSLLAPNGPSASSATLPHGNNNTERSVGT